MVLHFKSKSPLRVNKLAGAFIAIAAFLVQPLVTLNIPSAFAVSGPQYYVRADGSDTNCDGSANVADADTTTTACAKATVQAGINAAGSDATVHIGSGSFSASQYLVLAGHDNLTIDGDGKTHTTLQLTAAYDGFKVQANNVTLSDFTIDGTSVANYGLRAQGVDNLTVDNVKTTKMKKTGFDINGVTNSSFTDLTATDNGGNGFSVTDTLNLTFTDTRSSGNAWGGMGIYTHGGAFVGRCGVDGISFSGVLNLQEVGALYTGIDSSTCTSITNVNIPSTALPYKVTLNNTDPQDIYTASQANAESLVSAYGALSPVVRSTETGHYVVVGGQTIQSVINAAPAGSVIDVPAGTYPESVSVNKAVTLVGAGSDDTGTVISGTSGTGLSLSAGTDATHRVVVQNLKVTGFTTGVTASSYNTLENVVSTGNASYGISLNSLNDLNIASSKFNNNTVGLKLSSAASANNVQITNSEFNGNSAHGWYSDKSAASGSYLTNLSVANTSFSDNGQKGFYTEKLSYATFDHVTINNSGFTGSYGSGLNINLKYGNYQNITIQNSVVTNSGRGDALYGTGINIEARDDGSYASNPATLNNVTISGGQVTDNQVGLRFGESGKNNAGPTGVTIMGVNLSGNVAEAINNQTTATITAVGNWWGHETGPTAGQYTGDVIVTPWCDVADCSSLFSDEPVQLEVSDGQGTTDVPLALSSSTPSGPVSVEIPENTTITSDSGWDGTITPPTIDTTYDVPGASNTTGLVITVGSDEYSLSFDKPVKLILPGQKGKLVGWQAPGSSTFTPITTDCSTYLPDLNAGMPVGGDCKTTDDTDLVIWTKHFTTFATYTVATTNGDGSGGGSGGGTTTTSPAPTPTTIFGGVFNVTPNQGTKSGNGIKDDNGEILGTNTSPKKTTANASAKDNGGIILGLAWYWWVAILAVLGLVWWGFSAWRTRRSDTF
ncbi:hypothetical protein RAAC3_TM7C00001G0542 [Candidatus Saccharibacteria bacterium RAAC3_TM7_1]|nr:hypothetical protein RAAC3_TM7C00001G0542 [Candidatus Saccharibacteria bacterium RAAC3_TM7_1]HCZ28669.1 hypothetical protein [Candidatus Saccharibacteria bacterium]